MSAGAIFGMGLLNAGLGMLNNMQSHYYSTQNLYDSYELNEQAAQNADLRTRGLYNDIYSPQALLKQYKEAGLSPSLMFGGTPGQGGSSGAQAGVGMPATIYSPISMMEGAQLAAIQAQTEKTKAETANINVDTDIKALQEEWQEMANSQYKTEFTLLNAGYQMPDGTIKSYYDIAGDYNNFDKFINACREAAIQAGDQGVVQTLASEQGLKTMRSIYIARKEFAHNISVLSSNKVSADFQKSVLEAMNEEGFPEWNAKAALAYLQQNVEAAKLDKAQKEAWNNLIDTLKAKNSKMADIAIVLGMVVNQALTNWKMPSINSYRTTDNSVRTINVKSSN